MEIKVGIAESGREIVFESNAKPEELESSVNAALATSDGVLRLKDSKGSTFMFASSKLAYVEMGPGDKRKVGFLSA